MASGNVSRREFLSAALVGLSNKSGRAISGGFVNESQLAGHKLRDRVAFAAPAQTVRIPLVIVGGGISGLSAAWRLQKKGFQDFVLLEMEPSAGGNARSGRNDVSAYPWAAHYVPIPNREAVFVKELMEELGVLRDGKYEERYLCFSPQERLFLHGRWQEGLEPDAAAARDDRDQFRRFMERIKEFRATGEFTIPMELGSKPSDLDRISITQWLDQNRFTSAALRWYVDYACRDDYGAQARHTSAWAGIHYFAAREHDEKGPLTWPEGNGWILARLLAKVASHVRTNALVYRIQEEGPKLAVYTPAAKYVADRVIFAAPTFTARYVLEKPPEIRMEYSPWFTANLTLDRLPRQKGFDPAWDNVIYNSPSLGYVNATHMSLRSQVDRTVWTYYWALAEGTPAENRRWLLASSWETFRDRILDDLSRAHPDIRDCVSHIDVMRFGHAMARPVPGTISSPDRLKLCRPAGKILFANSDLSGFSIFEEAQYRGVQAADAAIHRI